MSCYHPIKRYITADGGTFEKPHGHSGAHTKHPCRKCTGCRLDHRTEWSLRMMHEASMHEDCQFVTLTYDDDHLPEDQSLDQTHMQKFFRRLRKEFSPKKIRFVYSGEYGGQTSRPHYHAIIFGLELDDLKKIDKNERGEPLYQSEKLEQIWGNGYCIVGAVTHQSCGYVASYMLKDIEGNYNKDEPYEIIDLETGEVRERRRPFARYSNRPGIGRSWFDEYHADCFPSDFITSKGKKYSVPGYYFRLLEERDPETYAEVKERREAAIYTDENKANTTKERLKSREICRKAKLSLRKRGTQQKPEQKTAFTVGMK